MIRVELVYGRRSTWGALAQRWGAALLGIVSACALLYLLPVERWLADGRTASAAADGALVAEPVGGNVLPDGDALPTAISEPVLPVHQELSAADAESAAPIADADMDAAAIVLPPIGEPMPVDEVGARGEAEHGAVPSITTACFSAVTVASTVPAESQLGLVSCSGDGRYELSGTVKDSRGLAAVQAALANVLDGAVLSSDREGDGAIHFFVAGRSGRSRDVALATLAQVQARAFFARVEYWADLCGIDDISLGAVSELPVDGQRQRWRRRLVGTGSYGQIDALLSRMATAGETAGLVELILTPVSGAGGRDRAMRLSGAIDVVVHR